MDSTSRGSRTAFILVWFVWACSAVATEGFQLRGIVTMEAERYVSLSSASGQSGWLKVGQQFDLHVVKEIRPASIILVGPDRREREIPLAAAPTKPLGATDGLMPIEQLDWTWIRSDANPMRREAPDLPYEIASGWNALSADERIRIENYYRLHGWTIHVAKRGERLFVTRARIREPGSLEKLDPDKFVEVNQTPDTRKGKR
jgi:hypothetical protein